MWGTERIEYKGRIIEIFENGGQYLGYVEGKRVFDADSRGQAIELCKKHIDTAATKNRLKSLLFELKRIKAALHLYSIK